MEQFDTLIKKSYDYHPDRYKRNITQWNILSTLYDRNFVNGVDRSIQHIPKKIHQIWLGGNFPDKYQRWANTWKQFHPDWEYHLWTDDDVSEIQMTNPTQYNTISNYGPKSDFLRYHILNQFGGIYVDTDFECLKSFDDLLFADFITGIGYPMKTELYVGLIASVPHHPITERLVAEVSKGTRDVVLGDVLNVISAYFFTRNFFSVVGDYMPRVFALPMDYFYPFPNVKGHEQLDGHRFIKPCSYAVHHWAVSWAIRSGQVDWIQGDRFKEIADSTYSPNTKHHDDYDKLLNTFDPSDLKPFNIVYTHTFYVKQLFNIIRHLGCRFVVITHNSDMNVDESFVVPKNIIRWYAQNVNVSDPRIQAIPIGLPNNRWDPHNQHKVIMNECLKTQRSYRNLVYVNCNTKTNPKRKELYKTLAGKPWATVEPHSRDFRHYISNVYTHKFVVCPEGNGLDTHRLWETLYMGTIPILLCSTHSKHWTGIPICFVNNWSDLTKEFLDSEWERIRRFPWNYGKLNFEYWRKTILTNA